MKNFINRLFGKNTENTSETTADANIEDLNVDNHEVDVPEEIFTTLEAPLNAQSEPVQPKKPKNDFDALLVRDHHSKGYTDGYDYQDPDLMANYKATIINEAETCLKDALREIDMRMTEFKRWEGAENLTRSVQFEIGRERAELELKRTDLLDRLEATMEGRGPIMRALKAYEDGFTRGFLDRRQTQSLSKVFNY